MSSPHGEGYLPWHHFRHSSDIRPIQRIEINLRMRLSASLAGRVRFFGLDALAVGEFEEDEVGGPFFIVHIGFFGIFVEFVAEAGIGFAAEENEGETGIGPEVPAMDHAGEKHGKTAARLIFFAANGDGAIGDEAGAIELEVELRTGRAVIDGAAKIAEAEDALAVAFQDEVVLAQAGEGGGRAGIQAHDLDGGPLGLLDGLGERADDAGIVGDGGDETSRPGERVFAADPAALGKGLLFFSGATGSKKGQSAHEQGGKVFTLIKMFKAGQPTIGRRERWIIQRWRR